MIPIGNTYRDLTVSQAQFLTLIGCLYLLTTYPAYEKRILVTVYADERMGGRESLG